MPDWDKINGRKRLEILKGQTANQLWSLVIARANDENEYPSFKDLLKVYEEEFPKLLEVNKKLLIGGDKDESR